MGGFMLYDERGPKQVLLPEKLKALADEGTIDFPNTTEGEIQDRSKGDFLSKGLVVLQTTWFIMQCCARGIEGLPLTELEIVTLAYAAVNFVKYAIWWNKPLNVQYAYRIQKKLVPNSDKQKENVTGGAAVMPLDGGSTQHGAADPLPGGAASADTSSQEPGFFKRYFPGPDAIGYFIDTTTFSIAPFCHGHWLVHRLRASAASRDILRRTR